MGDDISETEEGSDSDEKREEEQESEESFDDVPWGDESDDSVPEETNEEESNEEEDESNDGLNKPPENNPFTPTSLHDSRKAALVEERRWKGIDEKFLSTGLRLLHILPCLLYTSPSPRDATLSRMPSSA